VDEMTRARSLFHAFFDDNDGWHVTAVGLLSWRHQLRPSTDVNKRVHCVRAGQFTSGPPHIQWTTVNHVGGEPGLAFSM